MHLLVWYLLQSTTSVTGQQMLDSSSLNPLQSGACDPDVGLIGEAEQRELSWQGNGWLLGQS